MAELDTPDSGRSSSPDANRNARESKWTFLTDSTSLRRSVSFSEQSIPVHSRCSSPCGGHVVGEEENTNNNANDERRVGAEDHNRESNHQNDVASLDQASSDSSSLTTQNLKRPWYRRLASNYHSISLENKGSVARDHLALERTFLAWLRTSLAFASIGIAITQLFRLNTSLAEEKRRRRRNIDDHPFNSFHTPRDDAAALPLSPLMGASLTPELYEHIQSLLHDQRYPIPNPAENSASSLLDQILRPGPNPVVSTFDSDSSAKLRHLGKPLGATFLGISIVILFIGFHRYFESQHWIIRGHFPASRGSIALVGLIAVMLIVASLVLVLVVGAGGS